MKIIMNRHCAVYKTIMFSLLSVLTLGQFIAKCSQLATVMVMILASMGTSLARTAPDSRCSVDHGLVPDQSFCQAFIICLQGTAKRMFCSRDLLFNQDRLMCDFPGNVQCGSRPTVTGSDRPRLCQEGSQCYTAMINVTVKAENQIKVPTFAADMTFRAQRQTLRYILLIAAGLSQTFRFETEHIDGYGDYISSINGLSNDLTVSLSLWTLFDKKRNIIKDNLDDYYPGDNEVLHFVFTNVTEQPPPPTR